MSEAPSGILNAVTVDVEEYFQVSAFDEAVARDTWASMESRVRLGTERLLDLFERHEVHGTFFVLGWLAERMPDLVLEIHRRGHEVASHGYEHGLVDGMTPDAFRDDLARAKRAIEGAAPVSVKGFRAPSFSISREATWAFDVLREDGYTFSSSVFPVRHDRYGIPDFPRHPVALSDEQGRVLREFPMTTWRVLGRNVPAAGGGWMRALPPTVMHRAIRATNGDGWPAIVYVHPWEVDPDQPRIQQAPWASRFRHYLNLDRTLDRLDKLLAAYPFGTLTEALDGVAPRIPVLELASGALVPTPGDR